jgi:hypothetical protein
LVTLRGTNAVFVKVKTHQLYSGFGPLRNDRENPCRMLAVTDWAPQLNVSLMFQKPCSAFDKSRGIRSEQQAGLEVHAEAVFRRINCAVRGKGQTWTSVSTTSLTWETSSCVPERPENERTVVNAELESVGWPRRRPR